MNIESLLDGLLRREGGYVDHPADRGGKTNWGITLAVAREAGFMGDMRDLPRDVAKAIYRRRYWEQPGFDKVAALSLPLAEELFDTGANMGPAVAAGFLQRALNAFNRGGRDWADIVVDRRIGPATLEAVRRLIDVRGAAGARVLVRAMNALQGARYVELTEQRPENKAFAFGWIDQRVDMAGDVK